MLWFLEDRYFGESPPFHTRYAYTESYAYYCPVCGAVWFRAQEEGRQWTFRRRKCPSHGSAMLNTLVHSDFLSVIPLELLKRETLINLELRAKGRDPEVELVCDRD